jgi:DNA-binding response OmpR family regulator
VEVFVSTELPDARICTVLVAEEDDGLRGAIVEVLENDGFATFQAPSVEDALLILAAQRPDFVVLDLNLSTLNGPDFFRLKAGDFRVAAIPVIGITASPNVDVPRGAVGLLRKPFNLDEFLRILDRQRGLGRTGT